MSAKSKEEIQMEMKTLHENLTDTRKRLNALKRQFSRGEVENYQLAGTGGTTFRLSDLLGDKDDLIVIQNMGRSCVYCTLWADGFMGLLPHLRDRAAFVVVSPDAPAVQQEFAESRGWTFRMLSSEGSNFKRDLGFESEAGEQIPGISTFCRKGDKIINVANDFFGPGDDYCSVWHMFDLLDKGPHGWGPKFKY